MAASRAAGSARPVQGGAAPRDRIAEALYTWCTNNHAVGHVFNQDHLLDSGLIPGRDLNVLVAAVSNLVGKNLFRTHDIRATGTIGWELVSHERAENYQGLTREEHLVFSHIDAAGNQGLWTRTLQKRLQAHAKVLERTYKSLEQKGKIKGMKSVKHPTRKMYIVAGLQPSEDATGGAWFHDGNLDQGSIDGVAMWAEKYISDQSWVAVKPNLQQAEQVEDTPTKGKGKSKAASIDDEQPRSISPEMHHREQKSKPKRPPTRYYPHPPGHHGYPTAAMITNEVNASGVIKGRLPVTAVTQLLEVMVYDDKLYKMYRELRSDEISLDSTTDQVAMYRCFKTPGQLEERFNTTGRLQSHSASTRKAARREVELEEVGRGGASEVPCLKCPAFDICGDGGPVNVVTCPYFDEWYLRTARADRDDDHPWADGEDFLKVGERRKQQRIDAITRPPPPVPIEIKTEAMDTTA